MSIEALPRATAAAGADAAFRHGTRRSTLLVTAASVAVVLMLVTVPFSQGPSVTYKLTNLCVLVVLASMWNLMAGFGGMVSVGLQAYIGVGGYLLLYLTDHGLNVYVSVPAAAVGCAMLAYPMSFAAFRLSGGYFAIGTWVMAEVCRLLLVHVDSLGAGGGRSLLVFSGVLPAQRQANVYWLAVGVLIVTVTGTFLLLRSRTGSGLTAVRDDIVSAHSSGVRITRTRRLVFLVAAAGCGACGALLLCTTLRIQPGSAFSVSWTASMIFCVVIGGVGTIEGPILGAVLYFVVQDQFAQHGSWYLIVLGLIAIAMAKWMRQGLWGVFHQATGISMFPTHVRVVRSESVRTTRERPPAVSTGQASSGG
jgi:branched-chain amino acid transport system permease protein